MTKKKDFCFQLFHKYTQPQAMQCLKLSVVQKIHMSNAAKNFIWSKIIFSARINNKIC